MKNLKISFDLLSNADLSVSYILTDILYAVFNMALCFFFPYIEDYSALEIIKAWRLLLIYCQTLFELSPTYLYFTEKKYRLYS